ncbi:Mlp family lipoprotein (plasmid) [Borreliella yangtzensis]|uniref:Signal recognition particle GTPase n=1 Tax=Borreliella yangtzensis TaxID=683292 RepID=A0ABR6PBP6_9SPIR|nr:signal recognition particle GTPase [Borreliella yangtzensis]
MKIINILFCLFILILNSCNSNNNETSNKNNMQQETGRQKRDLDTQGLQQQEKITLTEEEKKIFNSLTNAFQYIIEKLPNEIQGCNKENDSKCTDFFNWLSKDIQKQKELASAFKKVYDFLESKRQSKANNEDFDTYIKGAIDCKTAKDKANNQKREQDNQNDCNKDNKYGSDENTNLIEEYFRGVTNDMSGKNSNKEIYQYLKDELLKTDNHYSGLTSNWQN